ITQQPRACVTPFDKIVAENPVLGEASAQRPLECVNIIDPLADKRAFSEDILVDIRYGACVWVDAGITPVQARIPRAVCAGQTHSDTRLKDAVTINDPLRALVEARTVQRVRHGPHKLPGR